MISGLFSSDTTELPRRRANFILAIEQFLQLKLDILPGGLETETLNKAKLTLNSEHGKENKQAVVRNNKRMLHCELREKMPTITQHRVRQEVNEIEQALSSKVRENMLALRQEVNANKQEINKNNVKLKGNIEVSDERNKSTGIGNVLNECTLNDANLEKGSKHVFQKCDQNEANIERTVVKDKHGQVTEMVEEFRESESDRVVDKVIKGRLRKDSTKSAESFIPAESTDFEESLVELFANEQLAKSPNPDEYVDINKPAVELSVEENSESKHFVENHVLTTPFEKAADELNGKSSMQEHVKLNLLEDDSDSSFSLDELSEFDADGLEKLENLNKCKTDCGDNFELSDKLNRSNVNVVANVGNDDLFDDNSSTVFSPNSSVTNESSDVQGNKLKRKLESGDSDASERKKLKHLKYRDSVETSKSRRQTTSENDDEMEKAVFDEKNKEAEDHKTIEICKDSRESGIDCANRKTKSGNSRRQIMTKKSQSKAHSSRTSDKTDKCGKEEIDKTGRKFTDKCEEKETNKSGHTETKTNRTHRRIKMILRRIPISDTSTSESESIISLDSVNINVKNVKQGRPAVAKGNDSGPNNGKGTPAVAMGNDSGPNNGKGRHAVAMGNDSGPNNGKVRPAVALGNDSGPNNGKGRPAVALGNDSGPNNGKSGLILKFKRELSKSVSQPFKNSDYKLANASSGSRSRYSTAESDKKAKKRKRKTSVCIHKEELKKMKNCYVLLEKLRM